MVEVLKPLLAAIYQHRDVVSTENFMFCIGVIIFCLCAYVIVRQPEIFNRFFKRKDESENYILTEDGEEVLIGDNIATAAREVTDILQSGKFEIKLAQNEETAFVALEDLGASWKKNTPLHADQIHASHDIIKYIKFRIEQMKETNDLQVEFDWFKEVYILSTIHQFSLIAAIKNGDVRKNISQTYAEVNGMILGCINDLIQENGVETKDDLMGDIFVSLKQALMNGCFIAITETTTEQEKGDDNNNNE